MKLLSSVLSLSAVLLLSVAAQAAELTAGTYMMKTDAMQMSIEIVPLPGGAWAVNGEGKSASGSSCRIGDLGALQGTNLVIGTCSVPVAIAADGFDILASPDCIQCQPGATIQGTYKKQ